LIVGLACPMLTASFSVCIFNISSRLLLKGYCELAAINAPVGYFVHWMGWVFSFGCELLFFFSTKIIAYEVLQGHVPFFLKKDKHFYKFLTLQFLASKTKLWNILLRIQKIGQKWSTLVCKYLAIHIPDLHI